MGFPAVRACEPTAFWRRSAAVREQEAAYATATIELFSRLWDELENLNSAASSSAPARVETRLLMLRLDLHLLVETCDSSRWRTLLAPIQRSELNSVIDRVLATVDVSPLQKAVLAQAQNILFDAVLDLCRRLSARGHATPHTGA